ncbi:MAG: FimV/HubP family polar landmark protein [Burkholderiaceae bacterium]|nr:FimV/HubP family polar landmark protein [Burkholderiaceae bacterium]
MHIKSSSSSRTLTQTSSPSWRTTAIAAALGVLLSAAHLDAQALALGRLTTLSALGEPLRAEIDIPEINAEEFASFKATLATPEAFQAAGMEYNPALASAQFILQRRTNGSAFIQLRSLKAVSDPFVNLVINAKWSSGQIVRNYTLLLDPPVARQSETPAVITAPMATLPAAISAPAMTSAPAAAPAAGPRAESTTAAAPMQKPTAIAAPKPSPQNSGEQHKVASGDTAGKIAASNKPANVSLDQMLVAMLRGNPEAFIGNNINRLKAGAVLSLPTSEQAQAISDSDAHQNVIAQSKDFNNFRRKLAENAPSIASKAPDRQASGKVEAKVEERKAAVVTPDKLTLSKGSLNGAAKAAGEAKDNSEKIARERQARDDAARVAELSKNISDLNKIASGAVVSPAAPAKAATPTTPGATATVPGATATATAATGAVAVTTPAVTPVTPAPTVAVPAPNAATAATAASSAPPVNTATAVTPASPAKPTIAPAAPVAESSFMADLMTSPAVLPAAGGLLVLLAAAGLYAANQRKKRAAEKDEELDAEFEDQSFFDTTNHEPVIQAAPLAEPAVHTPTPEPSFTLPPLPIPPVPPQPAPEVPEMAPVAVAEANLDQELEHIDTFPTMTPPEFSARTVAQLDPESAKSPASVDLDLDFDFDVSGFHDNVPTAAVMPAAAPAATLDFEMASTPPTPDFVADHPAAAIVVAAPAMAVAAAASASPEPKRGGLIEFDLDNLSLDLNASNKPVSSVNGVDNAGPLETKLALAQEFRAIGDATGAKMLAQEVIALASGSLKIKAENLLAEIG